MFLILTNEKDITSDYVVVELRRRGLPFFRLNCERLPEFKATFRPEAGEDGWRFESERGSFDLSQCTAAYFRRPGKPEIRNPQLSEENKIYCETEWTAVFNSLVQSLQNRWLNRPNLIGLAENKPRQLALAHDLGFRIPETVIGNSSLGVNDLVSRFSTVVKPLRSALIGGERGRVIFTNRLDRGSVGREEAMRVAPFIAQKEIYKKADIRATVIGKKVFSAEIDSQSKLETEVDWRNGSYPDLNHDVHDLPEVERSLSIELVEKLGLRYGAIDLILDKNDKYWFLEVNPNGQWAWIENRTGMPLTAAIVDELEGIRDGK